MSTCIGILLPNSAPARFTPKEDWQKVGDGKLTT